MAGVNRCRQPTAVRPAAFRAATPSLALARMLLPETRMTEDSGNASRVESLSIQDLEHVAGGALGVPGLTESGIRHRCPDPVVAKLNPGCGDALKFLKLRDRFRARGFDLQFKEP